MLSSVSVLALLLEASPSSASVVDGEPDSISCYTLSYTPSSVLCSCDGIPFDERLAPHGCVGSMTLSEKSGFNLNSVLTLGTGWIKQEWV